MPLRRALSDKEAEVESIREAQAGRVLLLEQLATADEDLAQLRAEARRSQSEAGLCPAEYSVTTCTEWAAAARSRDGRPF